MIGATMFTVSRLHCHWEELGILETQRGALVGSKNGSMSQIGSLALLIALAVYSFLAGDPGSGPGAARFGTIR